MDEQAYKEVYYHVYCSKCKHEDVPDTDEPCNECLDNPLNWNSHRPVKYEEKGAVKMNESNRIKYI